MNKHELKKLAILKNEIENKKHDRKLKQVYRESMKVYTVNIEKYKENILEIINANLNTSTKKTISR